MKKRIKIDSSILSFVILLTGFLYLNKSFFLSNQELDNLLDFVGVILILKGVLLRMTARAYKKSHSKKGDDLVTSGIYGLTRNPMYLGSFTIGLGFVFMVWPWWSFPIFIWLFFLRFKIQVEKEEKYLGELFGDKYKQYCNDVPRIFPNIKKVCEVKIEDIFSFEEALSTKERRGLAAWPLLAIVLESLQQKIVFGSVNLVGTISIVILAAATYILIFFTYKLIKS